MRPRPLPLLSEQSRRRYPTDGAAPVEILRRFRVTGKVQGVYFRQSTRIEAKRLGLRGMAQNLPDGSVDVLALGEAAAVDALRLWLHRGPSQAHVDGVREINAGEAAATKIPVSFEVR
jgi:acylphosphatase